MRDEIRDYVRRCFLCACYKNSNTSTTTTLRPHQPKKPWDTISVDLMGPYPRSSKGRRFILVTTDMFSRWVEAFPIGSSDTTRVIRILEEEVFSRWGYPRAILSDKGPQFISKAWKDACNRWETQHWTTAIYHPRANPVERRNQEIKKGLRLHLQDEEHRKWDLYLPTILFQLRSRHNATTGYTPAQLLLGHDLQRPGIGK